MRLARTLAVAVAFAAAAPAVAMAQFTPIPNASQMPPGGGGQPACAKDFVPIRENTEKAAAAIKTASQKKSPLTEVCKLFNAFIAAENKMLKFMETNNVWCGIPPQAIEQVKTNHAQVSQVRKKVCDAAKSAGAAGAPPPPSLSDALGTTRVPDATTTTTKSGGGTFDTLTGNPLAR